MQAAMPAECVLLCTRQYWLVLSSKRSLVAKYCYAGPDGVSKMMLPQHPAYWVPRE